MNNAFLKMIFSSKKFADDYASFLGNLILNIFTLFKIYMKTLPCKQTKKNLKI